MKQFVLGVLKSAPTAQPATAISVAISSAAHLSRTGISPLARHFSLGVSVYPYRVLNLWDSCEIAGIRRS